MRGSGPIAGGAFATARPASPVSWIRRTARSFGRRDFELAAKRFIDILVSAAALILLAPLLLFIAVLILFESGGPVLFTQRRWGQHRRPIAVLKFRTMQASQCDATGIAQTIAEDPRVTPLGKVLRKTNLDELPQLINVLRGDMSLIGPRCHPIGMRAAGKLYEHLVPAYHYRHEMRPGMTGLAQIRGWRGPTTSRAKARARIACDLHYARNFGLWLDLKIALGTIPSQFRRGGGF